MIEKHRVIGGLDLPEKAEHSRETEMLVDLCHLGYFVTICIIWAISAVYGLLLAICAVCTTCE